MLSTSQPALAVGTLASAAVELASSAAYTFSICKCLMPAMERLDDTGAVLEIACVSGYDAPELEKFHL